MERTTKVRGAERYQHVERTPSHAFGKYSDTWLESAMTNTLCTILLTHPGNLLEGPSSCEDGLQEAQPHKDALAQGKEKQDAEYPQARSVQAGKQPDHREIWLVPLVGPEDSSRQEKATLKYSVGISPTRKHQ
ncbi:hypothetical protein Q9233_006612 [Columba guinea]|nr:hypothetical protein Q9233_006612 [Columba guinea]